MDCVFKGGTHPVPFGYDSHQNYKQLTHVINSQYHLAALEIEEKSERNVPKNFGVT